MGSGRIGAALACAAIVISGCGSAASAPSSTASSNPAPSSPAPSSAPPSSAPPSSPAPSSPAPSSPAAAAQTATSTFIAEGQSLTGPALYKPACASGCELSGDATAFLDAMTWSSWTTTSALGSGTYKLNDCMPNCAQGTVYPVAVTVTLSQPVKACSGGTVKWYWTRASFTFPKGLPKNLQGQNAPQNPWDFTQLATAAQQSCG